MSVLSFDGVDEHQTHIVGRNEQLERFASRPGRFDACRRVDCLAPLSGTP